MTWTESQLPDLTGTTAVVTGANSGIGLVTTRELAAHGAEVVMACRNVEAGQRAASGISGSVRVEALDLADQASIAEFAKRWDGPLDLLVNNAGVMAPPRYRETADGHELQFGTNHLGHFALTGRLLPALAASSQPRVVTVSSIAHFGGDAEVLRGNKGEGRYSAQKTYSQSKLANLLFSAQLQRRAEAAGSPLICSAAHPGVSATNLVASPDGLGALPLVKHVAPLALRIVLQSAKAGARPSLYAATEGGEDSYTGPQWLGQSRGPIGPAKRSAFAADAALAEQLWELSEGWTGVSFDF